MSYKDFFGEQVPTMTAPETTTPRPDSSEPAPPGMSGLSGMTGGTAVEEYSVVSFQGFSSGEPLLLESPVAYYNRIVNSMRQILALPADDRYGGIEGRVLLSPLFSLPFALPREGDMIANETVNLYPFLHFPSTPEWDPEEMGLDEYLLAIEYMFVNNGVVWETEEGDLLTYGMGGSYEIFDDAWSCARDWVHEIKKPLARLNCARICLFAIRSRREDELEMAGRLLDAWRIKESPRELIAGASDAAEDMRELYGMVFDGMEFDPLARFR